MGQSWQGRAWSRVYLVGPASHAVNEISASAARLPQGRTLSSLALTAGLALLYARIEHTTGAVDQLMAWRAGFQNKGWQGVIIQPEVVIR